MTCPPANEPDLNCFSLRRFVELNQKLQSLEDDFNLWFQRSAKGEEYSKHHGQIRRARGAIEPLL